jgi:HlyD family secretion protein
MKIRVLVSVIAVGAFGALAWGALRVGQATTRDARADIPTAHVKKGRVTIVVAARGELQGGNSEILTAPMAGGGDLAITFLREPGEPVQPGEVVARFDTTQQEFTLREAEADLAEAEQQVLKAEADSEVTLEEARYQVLSTAADVRLAELEVRKNGGGLPAVQARQNEIALEATRNLEKQAHQDLDNKTATAPSGIAIQTAAVNKAKVIAQNARTTIDGMVLKAKTAGYVHIQQNSNQNMLYYGQQLPLFQVGDGARAGQAVAQIPDMRNWEVSARIPEVDRGHLKPGQPVNVRVAAVPGRVFNGHIKSIGAASGSAWQRTFESRIGLDDGSPELRPGMSANILITVESLDDVLWVPSQALFESDGRSFVYLRTAGGFTPRDVALVRRSESQAVISGITENEVVALSNPNQASTKPSQVDGVMNAISK